ncbi:MAG: hypothetical protein V3T77_06675, partial [Planctomycetota bacterium]
RCRLRVISQMFSDSSLPDCLAPLEFQARGGVHLVAAAQLYGSAEDGDLSRARRHLGQALAYDPALRKDGYSTVVQHLLENIKRWGIPKAQDYLDGVFRNLPHGAEELRAQKRAVIYQQRKIEIARSWQHRDWRSLLCLSLQVLVNHPLWSSASGFRALVRLVTRARPRSGAGQALL